MPVFHITWRPSGGRGEFEYSPIDAGYENKPLHIHIIVDGHNRVVPTDTFLAKKGGKRRLRRQDRNDRSHLSVPNLVTAIMALPKPTRDRDNIVEPILAEGRWAIGSLEFEIESNPGDSVVRVRPLSLLPRHFTAPILFNSRVKILEAEASLDTVLGADVKRHLALIAAKTNTVALEGSSLAIFEAFVAEHAGVPVLAGPEEIEVAQSFVTAEADTVPAASGTEGRKKMVAHVLRERNKGLVKEKKKSFTAMYGRLYCECCSLAPADMYGSVLDGLIEAHHRIPLSECAEDEVRVTSLDDLVLLCRNCHGAAHRLNPMPALDALRALLRMRPQAILPSL